MNTEFIAPLTDSQQLAVERMTRLARLYYSGIPQRCCIRPRLWPLMVGPTGSGKSYIARRIAHALGAEYLRLSYGDWVVQGAKHPPTLYSIVWAALSPARLVVHLDELDKLPIHSEQDWGRAVANEIWGLLDGALPITRMLQDPDIDLLNERFYRELANWYFWALPQVDFPADLEPDTEKRRATGLIRLLTRLIFCWFLKEKGVIPDKLFHPTDLAKLLRGFDPESGTSSTYYLAILQNLFFATLNQRMGKDSNGRPYRRFAFDEGFLKNKSSHDLNNYFRYESLFHLEPDDALALFEDIPFLNGGLFECLDKRDEDREKTFYLDGFSRNPKKRPHVPDRLFFDSGETADLSQVYDDKKRRAEKVTGLIPILNRYKFTIVENTPIDQEIALDPELLGKVFENLLSSSEASCVKPDGGRGGAGRILCASGRSGFERVVAWSGALFYSFQCGSSADSAFWQPPA